MSDAAHHAEQMMEALDRLMSASTRTAKQDAYGAVISNFRLFIETKGGERRAALSTAREEGRREGFEKARDGAVDAMRDTWQALAHGSPEYMAGLSDMLNHGTDAIRAMRDGAGEKAEKPEERVSNLCDCTGCPHQREYGCP